LDAGELEETTVGNYSGHAPTASQLRTNAANAFDAPWSDQTGLSAAVPSSAGVTDQILIEPSGSKPSANELIFGEPNAVFGILTGRFPPLAHLPRLRR